MRLGQTAHATAGTSPFTAPPKHGHTMTYVAALLLAAVLLALSALIHAAAAATVGGGWPSLGTTWLAAAAVILGAVLLARNGRTVCRWLCLLDGTASLGLLAVGAVNLSAPGDVVPPPGPVLGFAVASSALAIAGLVLAVLFFAAFYLLSRHRPDAGQHA